MVLKAPCFHRRNIVATKNLRWTKLKPWMCAFNPANYNLEEKKGKMGSKE
jgi:hypothetical protein